MKHKLTREVNGYRLIYLPDHYRAMKTRNWSGWVYEHVVVAEKQLGRPLRSTEVVHHLDFNRLNNRSENLLILERGQHAKLHLWLDRGAPGWQQSGENRVNSGKPKSFEPKYCVACNRVLQGTQKKYCSSKCDISLRSKNIPSKECLTKDLMSLSWEDIGRKYKVSSNSVRKWAKKYNLDKATLSQAEGTPSEGAETSGEIEFS